MEDDDEKRPKPTPNPLINAVYEARFAMYDDIKGFDDDDYRGVLERGILLNVKVLEATQTIGDVTRDVKREAQIAVNKWVKNELKHAWITSLIWPVRLPVTGHGHSRGHEGFVGHGGQRTIGNAKRDDQDDGDQNG